MSKMHAVFPSVALTVIAALGAREAQAQAAVPPDAAAAIEAAAQAENPAY